MLDKSTISNFIKEKYTVSEETVRKYSGSYSLRVSEFNNVGIRRIIISESKRKGICVEFWSDEYKANCISEQANITQGTKSNSSIAWKYVSNLDEAKDILILVLGICKNIFLDEDKKVDDEYDRAFFEKNALENMSPVEKSKYEGFWEIAKKLNLHAGSIFHVDHATSIKNGREGAVTYKNLQILVKGINVSKGELCWERLSYEQQCEHIVSCTKINPSVDSDYINFVLEQLKLYWD